MRDKQIKKVLIEFCVTALNLQALLVSYCRAIGVLILLRHPSSRRRGPLVDTNRSNGSRMFLSIYRA